MARQNKVGCTRRQCLQALAALGLSQFIPATAAARQASQLLRAIPSSGETIPALGLGTARTFDIGNQTRQRTKIKEVLRMFLAKGGRLIDTSPMYGNAETIIGSLYAELEKKVTPFYATKVWTRGKAAGIKQMQTSFERMRTKQIDLMQIHNLVDWRTHLVTLREWKQQGLIRYIGITHYRNDAHEELASILRQERLDFLQCNYSIGNTHADKLLLPLAKERGVAVLVNEPFESGNLFRKVKGKTLPSWASDFECHSWAQYFLKYILAHPAVTCAIPATSKPKHLLDNMQAGIGKLPDEAMRNKMRRHLEQL